MILKKIKIMNYRQLESVELDMQESSNNSCANSSASFVSVKK